uniref:Uncharacterized protein n=1 Tax=viral metagenome TaxID=1070528 RepID=A0A6C0LVE8_9ZZZZ
MNVAYGIPIKSSIDHSSHTREIKGIDVLIRNPDKPKGIKWKDTKGIIETFQLPPSNILSSIYTSRDFENVTNMTNIYNDKSSDNKTLHHETFLSRSKLDGTDHDRGLSLHELRQQSNASFLNAELNRRDEAVKEHRTFLDDRRVSRTTSPIPPPLSSPLQLSPPHQMTYPLR